MNINEALGGRVYMPIVRRVDQPASEASPKTPDDLKEFVVKVNDCEMIHAFRVESAVAELRRQLAEANDRLADCKFSLGYVSAVLGIDDDGLDLLDQNKHDEWQALADAAMSKIKDQIAAVTRERDELRRSIDDPELDCTDAAHPAWWRGHDHTAKVFCQLVNEILDGKDVSHGISGEPWQATKMRVADLRTKLATAEAERDELREDSRQLNIAMSDLDEQVTSHKQRTDKAEADAAAMRRTMTENESRLKDVIRRIGVSTTTGWITHELNHVLLDIPSGTAGRELLDRHKAELAERDQKISDQKSSLRQMHQGCETYRHTIKRLRDRLAAKDAEIAGYGDRVAELIFEVDELSIKNLRLTRKVRTAKTALVEHYRGKIDPAWFDDAEPIYTTDGIQFVWRKNADGTIDARDIDGKKWWYVQGLEESGFPRCNADGTPLAVEMPTMEEIEELIDGPCKAWRDDKSFDDESDAAMLRKLRELLQGKTISYHSGTAGVCVSLTHAQTYIDTLIAIRDGGK